MALIPMIADLIDSRSHEMQSPAALVVDSKYIGAMLQEEG